MLESQQVVGGAGEDQVDAVVFQCNLQLGVAVLVGLLFTGGANEGRRTQAQADSYVQRAYEL
jgi:hypothetical protein